MRAKVKFHPMLSTSFSDSECAMGKKGIQFADHNLARALRVILVACTKQILRSLYCVQNDNLGLEHIEHIDRPCIEDEWMWALVEVGAT